MSVSVSQRGEELLRAALLASQRSEHSDRTGFVTGRFEGFLGRDGEHGMRAGLDHPGHGAGQRTDRGLELNGFAEVAIPVLAVERGVVEGAAE